MINGFRVRDSGVELSPTGTAGRPENGIQPHGSSFFGNRGRIDAVAHAADQTATFGHSGGTGPPMATHGHPWPPMATYGHLWPPMATYGHLWPPLYSQVAHCYALVKTSTRETAQGLPAAFPGRLNRN